MSKNLKFQLIYIEGVRQKLLILLFLDRNYWSSFSVIMFYEHLKMTAVHLSEVSNPN